MSIPSQVMCSVFGFQSCEGSRIQGFMIIASMQVYIKPWKAILMRQDREKEMVYIENTDPSAQPIQ